MAHAPAMDPATLQARAQGLMARCGQDRNCLMREASAMSAASVAAIAPAVAAWSRVTITTRMPAAWHSATAAVTFDLFCPSRED